MLPSPVRMQAHDDPFGIYVHVPFCRERCPYCDFALTPVERAPSREFVAAAIAEMDLTREVDGVDVRARGRTAVSLYLGGGTPSMLEPADLGRLVEAAGR